MDREELKEVLDELVTQENQGERELLAKLAQRVTEEYLEIKARQDSWDQRDNLEVLVVGVA